MKFEEVKDIINKIDYAEMYPNLRTSYVTNILNKIIDDVEKASKNEEIIPLNKDEKELVNSIVNFTIDDCISALSKNDKQVLSAIIDLLCNVNSLYNEEIVDPRSIKIMKALISTRLSLDSELYILTNIMKRITKVFMRDQPSDNLSNKYYEEFEKYISTINHDDRY